MPAGKPGKQRREAGMPGCYASKAKHMTGKPGRSDVKPACKAGKRRRAADPDRSMYSAPGLRDPVSCRYGIFVGMAREALAAARAEPYASLLAAATYAPA